FDELRIDDDPFAHGSTSPTRRLASTARGIGVSLELPPSARAEQDRDPHEVCTPRHHSPVDRSLRRERRRDAQRHEPAHRLARGRRDVEAPEKEQDITQQQDETADEPPHLSEYGED